MVDNDWAAETRALLLEHGYLTHGTYVRNNRENAASHARRCVDEFASAVGGTVAAVVAVEPMGDTHTSYTFRIEPA